MRVIKCDVCGKEMLYGYEINQYTDFTENDCFVDLCDNCYDLYRDLHSEYLSESRKIHEEFAKKIDILREKYKKEILKLRKNS